MEDAPSLQKGNQALLIPRFDPTEKESRIISIANNKSVSNDNAGHKKAGEGMLKHAVTEAKPVKKNSKNKDAASKLKKASVSTSSNKVVISDTLGKIFSAQAAVSTSNSDTLQQNHTISASAVTHEEVKRASVSPVEDSKESTSLSHSASEDVQWALSLFARENNIDAVSQSEKWPERNADNPRGTLSNSTAGSNDTESNVKPEKDIFGLPYLPFVTSLKDVVLPFYRSETDEQINRRWKQQRQRLTADFKKKHKAAIRILKKNRYRYRQRSNFNFEEF